MTIKAQCEFECNRCHKKEIIHYPYIEPVSRTRESISLTFTVPYGNKENGQLVYWRHDLDADLCLECSEYLYKQSRGLL